MLAQRFQRAALRDNLIEHRVDGLLVMGSWLEGAEVFKVGEHGEQDLVAKLTEAARTFQQQITAVLEVRRLL